MSDHFELRVILLTFPILIIRTLLLKISIYLALYRSFWAPPKTRKLKWKNDCFFVFLKLFDWYALLLHLHVITIYVRQSTHLPLNRLKFLTSASDFAIITNKCRQQPSYVFRNRGFVFVITTQAHEWFYHSFLSHFTASNNYC